MNAKTESVSLIDPEHPAPIRNLSLRAKCIVEGLIAGSHRSPYHGFSTEFLEYRAYHEGESTRRIDWRKYAQTDRTVVRLFEDETNLYARILLDKSMSMGFRSRDGLTKFDYARTLAASLAWILIRQRDAVGLYLFDDGIGTAISPRSTNLQLRTILSRLERAEPGRKTRCGDAIGRIAQGIRKRGLCIVISDLLDDADAIANGLRHLRFKRQDVIVCRILDPMETAFHHVNRLRVRDMETEEEVFLDGDTASRLYEAEFRRHWTGIEETCRDFSIDSYVVTTNEPFHKALIRILAKRNRLF